MRRRSNEFEKDFMRSHSAIPQRNSVNAAKNRAGSAFIRKLTTFSAAVTAQ